MEDETDFTTRAPNARRRKSQEKIAREGPPSIGMLHHPDPEKTRDEGQRTVEQAADRVLTRGAAAVITQRLQMELEEIQHHGNPMPAQRFGRRTVPVLPSLFWTGQVNENGDYVQVIDRSRLPKNLKRDDIKLCIRRFIKVAGRVVKEIDDSRGDALDLLMPTFSHFDYAVKAHSSTPEVEKDLRRRFFDGSNVSLSSADMGRLAVIYKEFPARTHERFFGKGRNFDRELALQLLTVGLAESRDAV